MAGPPLTRRQRDIVAFFEEYTRRQGISPTLEEIAVSLGVNKVTVFGHVAELERKGVLVRSARGISRGLQIAPRPQTALERSTSLSILGSIAAGAPIEAIEAPEELDLAQLTPPGSDCYALRVRGDSMIDDGIHDGDVVIVESRRDAPNGATVVALVEGEATVKRFYRKRGRIHLEPANERMQAIVAREEDVELRGVVVALVRRYR